MTSNHGAVLRDLSRHIERNKLAYAKALTFTAEAVREAERKEMHRVFDRPTPYTLRSLYLKAATPATLTSRVWFKERVGGEHYLKPQVHGGDRRQKSFERVFSRIGVSGGEMTRQDMWIVPGSAAKLDAHGNISRGHIRQILSALGKAEHTAGYSANRTKASAKRKGKALAEYFIGAPGGGREPFGVWQRFRFAAGSAVKPVLVFVRRPVYRKRFDFFGVAKATAERGYPVKLQRELQRATK